MDLAARIGRLEDVEAIKRLKYRYWRCLDLKLWDELGGCFTDDATADYGEGRYRFAGAEAILRFLREALGRESGSVTVRPGRDPEVERTSGTTAGGTGAVD